MRDFRLLGHKNVQLERERRWAVSQYGESYVVLLHGLSTRSTVVANVLYVSYMKESRLPSGNCFQLISRFDVSDVTGNPEAGVRTTAERRIGGT